LSVHSYLRSRAVSGPWRIEGCTEDVFSGAVVIPALAESATLSATLSSLACNPPEVLQRFLVLVVVNHRPDAPPEDKSDNRRTLDLLRNGDRRWTPLNLAWVDAVSDGRELPLKGGGVGLARRIGMDLALSRLDISGSDPLLVCLDGDTTVRPDYLPAIVEHFRHCRAGAAAIPYEHQRGSSAQAERFIARYELFLRGYILGLELAGSPYAFHSVGSAMACRASAYCKIGGMNNRMAGEDFYFMQQMYRTVGVEQLAGTVVHPSPRPSHRVPFGTGRSIQRMGAGGEREQLFYRPECFRILNEWLGLVEHGADMDGAALLARSDQISPCLTEYLQLARFAVVWDKLQRNHPSRTALRTAFHGWLDGLKTMKLVHHLSDGPYPRCEPDEALAELFAWRGLEPASGVEEYLEQLRRLQNGSDHITPP
jgi:cellulose synthase/poly-beta-1,6-N-acetylglucosamine synthase-like glycosyltransferase